MIVQPKTDEVINAINQSKAICQFDDFETVDQLFDCANENNLLRQLHALYSLIAPNDTLLNRDRYHWKNLKSAMNVDIEKSTNLLQKIGEGFLDYYVNYGGKFLLVSKLNKNTNQGEIHSSGTFDSDFDLALLRNDESLETEITPLRILSTQKTEECSTFIFHESSQSFSQEPPNDNLLSDAGKQLKGQLFLKKRTLIQGFHKLIISKSLIIFLIDQTVLMDGNETAADKAHLMATLIRSQYKSFHCGQDFIYFFSAIKELYNDSYAGEVCKAHFTTSSGAKFTNNAKGFDLRKDLFQQGGEQAEPLSLNFTKLGLKWSDISGIPQCFLSGSSEMFNNEKSSLPSIEVLFSTEQNNQANFLKKVLDYAKW